MILKEYQKRALTQVKQYLDALRKERDSGNLRHAALDAWLSTNGKASKYHEKNDGLGRDLPNFCLKIPTGGGKTLLAVKTIDLINTSYLLKNTGLVLWVVPTTQIYRQTLQGLRDRGHPYRQHLDQTSVGKTLILEKGDKFTPSDINENLAVLLLMLPSASRQNKETLRMFRDSGGFQEFFPPEDEVKSHEALLSRFPNLDTFENEAGFWGRLVKTSLGNTLRTLNPVIILDEGHKAYSETAQDTLRGFNPAMIVELSATPNEGANVLVNIVGKELYDEEMIKLDLNIVNKASKEWRDVLRSSVNHRNFLEEKAQSYQSVSGRYIRPICLIQVESTGKDQRDGKNIHAEDVRDALIKKFNIAPEQIAIKTSEKDELKDVDDVGGLLSPNCQIRYIITKYALQEGWDCPFAYILTILTNPGSKNALTQLVGRILRQPFARKTKIPELDESYVYCYNQNANTLLHDIRKGFGLEGLGDLAGRIVTDAKEKSTTEMMEIPVRSEFKSIAKKFILPFFVVNDRNWRLLSYERDIKRKIEWPKIDLKEFMNLHLSETELKDTHSRITQSTDIHEIVEQTDVKKVKNGSINLDPVFLARQLSDIIPNPWQAYEIGQSTIDGFLKKYPEKTVKNNFIFIIEELRKYLFTQEEYLAESVFHKLIHKGTLKFFIAGRDLGYLLPTSQRFPKISRKLNRQSGEYLQKSLFEHVPEAELNLDEQRVAWYLDSQEKVLFWYRNMARKDYAIQGWKRNKIYPDFIFATHEAQGKLKTKVSNFNKVFVIETKGIHLKNEDSDYKSKVLDLCNELTKEVKWSELEMSLTDYALHYELLYTDQWQNRLNELV